MTRRVEADGDSSAAGRRSAWILRVIVGLIFFILVGGLVSYQERQRRRCDIAPECHLDVKGKADGEVYAIALRCISAGLERMPLNSTASHDVGNAVHLLLEILRQATQDARTGDPSSVEL